MYAIMFTDNTYYKHNEYSGILIVSTMDISDAKPYKSIADAETEIEQLKLTGAVVKPI